MGSIPTVINNIYLKQKLSGLNKPVTKENADGWIDKWSNGRANQPTDRWTTFK